MTEQINQALSGLVDIQRHLFGMKSGRKTIARRLIDSPELKAFRAGADICTLSLTPAEFKTAILSTGTANDPLVGSFMPAIDPGTRQPLKIRDLLQSFPTANGAIEMPVKTAATNGAGSQNREGTDLGESAYTFSTSFTPVQTLGHFVPASKQIFEDAGTLDGLINGELLHGLGDVEQDQLLNGTGTNSELTGLIPNATAYSGQSPVMTNESDIIRDAIKQVELAGFVPSAIILNPLDWYQIDTTKTATGTKEYANTNPRTVTGNSLWGLPVVVTNAIAAGTFLVGDFNRAAILFDREQPTIEVSRHHGNNFEKNMVTIKANNRLALVVTNPTALVTGSL